MPNLRYALSDPRAQSIVKLITESVQVENLRFLFNLPWVRHLFPEATGWNSQKKITKDVQDLVKDLVQEHKESYDSNDMRDFMDVYLQEIDQQQNPSSPTDFNENALLVTAMDLFSAGSETTATTLSWAVLYMILHPKIQEKIHKEIDEVLDGKEPSLEDKVK